VLLLLVHSSTFRWIFLFFLLLVYCLWAKNKWATHFFFFCLKTGSVWKNIGSAVCLCLRQQSKRPWLPYFLLLFLYLSVSNRPHTASLSWTSQHCYFIQMLLSRCCCWWIFTQSSHTHTHTRRATVWNTSTNHWTQEDGNRSLFIYIYALWEKKTLQKLRKVRGDEIVYVAN
jgi:hypothetical protein